ncbi:MAG: hypothetical protein ACFCU3_10520 [Verrucomicrobiales bacterium]
MAHNIWRDQSQHDDEAEGTLFPLQSHPTGAHGTIDRLDSEVQKAQEQLLTLRRQQELIERQKRELEQLSQKQEQFDNGKRTLVDQMQRGMIRIDKEGTELEKRLEQMRHARALFVEKIHELGEFDSSNWSPEELPKHLPIALGVLESAELEYEKCRIRLNAYAQEDVLEHTDDSGSDWSEASFWTWAKMGFAFTLPLVVVILLLGLFFMLRQPNGL